MQPVVPFWFSMRQGKMEPAGTEVYRLSAPNLKEGFITIRANEPGRWIGAVRQTADGPDLAVTERDYDNLADAWGAAFELYRNLVVL